MNIARDFFMPSELTAVESEFVERRVYDTKVRRMGNLPSLPMVTAGQIKVPCGALAHLSWKVAVLGTFILCSDLVDICHVRNSQNTTPPIVNKDPL